VQLFPAEREGETRAYISLSELLGLLLGNMLYSLCICVCMCVGVYICVCINGQVLFVLVGSVLKQFL